jgi:hypothetical protein
MEGIVFIIGQLVKVFFIELVINHESAQQYSPYHSCNECSWGSCDFHADMANANREVFMGLMDGQSMPVSFPNYWENYVVAWGNIPTNMMINPINALTNLRAAADDYCDRHQIGHVLDPH